MQVDVYGGNGWIVNFTPKGIVDKAYNQLTHLCPKFRWDTKLRACISDDTLAIFQLEHSGLRYGMSVRAHTLLHSLSEQKPKKVIQQIERSELPMIGLDVYGKEGFCLKFAYDAGLVNMIRQCAGFSWSPANKVWYCEGPEAILDLERHHVPYVPTAESAGRYEFFRRNLEQIIKLKAVPLTDELYSYQRIGTETMLLQKRGILADDMGLGKSKQSLDAVARVLGEHPKWRVLIAAPKSLIWNWKAELEKWYPDWTAEVCPDNPKLRKAFLDNPPPITICNYHKLIGAGFPEKIWDIFIADEATVGKNTKTSTHKAMRRVAASAAYAWLLTGTPLEMRVEELYGLFTIVRPSVFGGFTKFSDTFVNTDYMGNAVSTKNNQLLAEKIAPWLIRRTKTEVLKNLPPKIYNTISVPMGEQEYKDYLKIRDDFFIWYAEHSKSETASEPNILTQLLRLQQYTCSPSLLDYSALGSKVGEVANILDGWEGQVMMFTRFSSMAKLLVDWFRLPEDAIIYGEIGAQERVDRITRFNAGELGKLLISTDAGAYGLNVTSANLVIHYDLLWNPAKMRQREDRLHRIGQKGTVNVLYMVNHATLDEGMLKILDARQGLFDEVVGGTAKIKLDASLLKKLTIGVYR